VLEKRVCTVIIGVDFEWLAADVIAYISKHSAQHDQVTSEY